MQCVRPILVRGNFVPCGKCPNCLANQRQEWIFRLRSEYMACKFGLFVTLTYNDENYPATGTSKEDVQKFLKRLRKALGMRSFRYFIVSEYGDHTQRGHYHGLFFFQEACSLGIGEELYNVFVKAWNKGFLKFGNIEEGSIVYCTKYCLKQSPTPFYYSKSKEKYLECTKPFRLMSRMPGIGEYYIQKFGQYHAEQKKLAIANLFGVTSRMPRHFRVKFLTDFES